MSKRLFVLISVLVAASMLLAACGGGGGGGAATTLKIVSSLPMTGASLTQTQTIVNSEMLRLEQANYSACGGKYKQPGREGNEPPVAAEPFHEALHREGG